MVVMQLLCWFINKYSSKIIWKNLTIIKNNPRSMMMIKFQTFFFNYYFI
jgi:hypothetical protein